MTIPTAPPVTIASRQAFYDTLEAARAQAHRPLEPHPDDFLARI